MASIEPYQTTACIKKCGEKYYGPKGHPDTGVRDAVCKKTGHTLHRVRYRKPDGKQTDKSGFRSSRLAEDFLNTVEVKIMTGDYIDPAAGRITIDALGPAWLTRQLGHTKASGHRSRDSAWRIHVQPRWGATPVVAIAKTDVQAWIAEMRTAPKTGRKAGTEKGLAAPVIETAFGVLAGILDDAVSDRRISRNPARGVKLPPREDRPHAYLTHAQVHALAAEAKHYGPLVLLLSYCGLRWGEAAGLRVRHIDFLRRRIQLEDNAVTVGSKVQVGTLKGHHFRWVPAPEFVTDALAGVCKGKKRGDLLWTNRDGGHLGPPASKDSWLSGAVARCMAADETFPRVTAHDLRHTTASLAVSAGANVKAVQRMLGHKSAAMTLDTYADLFDDDLEAVASRLAEIVGDLWEKGTVRRA